MHAFTKRRKQQQNMGKNDTVSSGISTSSSALEEKSFENADSFSESTEDRSSSKILSENDEKSLEIDVSADSVNEIGDKKQQEYKSENVNNNRKRSASGGEVPLKKARNKPKPQIIEDMKDYYQKDSVHKLSTATLRHWLKDHLIHCTTRDKKDVLVEKVKGYFLDSTSQ